MPALLNISSYIVPCHQIKMKQVLEHALDRAEYIVESAQQRPPKRRNSTSARKSLNQKLYDLYLEECEKEPEIKKLRRNVNLLEKLVMQETLSCLVVNLYPGNEGYSLMLRGKNGTDSETIRLPYEECELLDYLDAEELPPILVDLLEKSQVNIFHCGCVIAEIRDYRQSGNTKVPTYKTRHILLRPTMQTLVCDVHAITSDNHKWTQDDKLLLESHLILATAEPLCLDPSISVTCTVNRLLYNKQKMNTYSMKRCFKRFSRPSLNRRLEMANYPTPPQLKLFDYIQKRKERKIPQSVDLKISRAGNCVDMWKQNSCLLLAPTELDVEKYATVEKSVKLEESQPSVWPAHDIKDDYIFECEVGAPFPKTKVTIYQCAGDPLFYGKIQVAKDLSRDDENDFHLIHPPFLIGSKIDADRFIKQYKDVYHKDAKCPIKMSHNSGGSVNHGQLSPSKEAEPDGISGSVQSSVLGKGVKHRPPPIKLPSGSGSNSSANAYSSQQSGSHLKSPTPPPSKSQSLSRKHSELNQVNLLSPSALSPVGSSQRSRGGGAYPGSNVRKAGLHHGRDASPSQGSGTPKPSTPTPTNTPSSTPHPPDIQTSTPSITPSATPTPQDSSMNSQPALLTSFAQQQMALSQTLPVMTIPLATMGTSITTGTSPSQVMTSPAGLNFINVVGSVCAPQMMSGSNPMLGCNPGTITSTGINLSGILPSGGLVPGALPTMQSGAQAGLRPLNLLQIPGGPLIFNSLQQQQLSQFSPQQSSTQSATSSPQQQSDQSSDQGPSSQDQTLSGQQTAVINLGGFMSPHSVAILTTPNASANGYGGSSGPGSSNPSSFKQPTKK